MSQGCSSRIELAWKMVVTQAAASPQTERFKKAASLPSCLGQEREKLPDKFARLLIIICVKRKRGRLTVGARNLWEGEPSDGERQRSFSRARNAF